jgi:hypothetical protein
MTTKYTFIVEDSDTKENIIISTTTDTGTWGAPVELFQRFLRAQGFIFGIDEHLGFMDFETDKFRDGSEF